MLPFHNFNWLWEREFCSSGTFLVVLLLQHTEIGVPPLHLPAYLQRSFSIQLSPLGMVNSRANPAKENVSLSVLLERWKGPVVLLHNSACNHVLK